MGAANAGPCVVSDTLSVNNGASNAMLCESQEPFMVSLQITSPAGFAPPLVALADEQTTISSPDASGMVTVTGASDFVEIAVGVSGSASEIILTSDSDVGGLSPLAIDPNSLVVLAETGGPQDLSQYFGFAANSGAVVVQSDTEAPEPPTLPIFLTGLGLMGLLLWRSKRNSAECPQQFRVLATATALFSFGLVLGVSSSWAVTLPAIPDGSSDGLATFDASGALIGFAFIPEPPGGGDTTPEGLIIVPLGSLSASGTNLDLIEPGTGVPGVVSDIIGIVTVDHTPVLALESDPLEVPAPSLTDLAAIPAVIETGTWQDISSHFGVPTGTIFAFSDAPEPTTLALLGSGLLGLVMMRRRKRPRSETQDAG
jgi:hypothetical protein